SGLIHRKVEDINTEIEASLAWRKDNKSELLEKFLELYFEFNNNEE
ncbi:LysR family transcriptional regulator, partial [Bacillus wiedmannii]